MTHPTKQPNPGLWLGLSIASTVLCCLPLGIAGIVFSAKGMGSLQRGDLVSAEEQTAKAKTWTLVAIIVGFIVNAIYVAVVVSNS